MNKIIAFITHPAISHSWLAEQLYGDKESKSRKKVSLKIAGKHQFNDTEIQQLIKIKKNFLKKVK